MVSDPTDPLTASVPPAADARDVAPVTPPSLWMDARTFGEDLARIKARVLELRAQIDPLYAELRALEQLQLEAEAPLKVDDEIEWTPTTGTRRFRGIVLGVFRSGDSAAYRVRLKFRDGTFGDTREVFHWYQPRRVESVAA